MSALAGCYVGYWTYTEHYNAADSALGEEHVINFAPKDALALTEDALRGDGILFEVQPDSSIITLWRPADPDTPGGLFQSLFGTTRQYRYEISIVPEGSRQSKIIVNVRTEGIPDDRLASYKASNRFAMFKEIDELATKYPPPSTMPSNGGVNFTLLPGENLQSMAKRVTGNADNWRQIAKDNGISSSTDITPFESIWVRNTLLRPVSK
ncbi:MAG: hypothetical protein ACREQN_18340 [Candidatus Binataceae bacterium]